MNNYEDKVEEFKKDVKVLSSRIVTMQLVLGIIGCIFLFIGFYRLHLDHLFQFIIFFILGMTLCSIFNNENKLIKVNFLYKNVKPYIIEGFKNKQIYKKDNLYFLPIWHLDKVNSYDEYITISNEYKIEEVYFLCLPNKNIYIDKKLYKHLQSGENEAILVLTQEEYNTMIESGTCMNLSIVY